MIDIAKESEQDPEEEGLLNPVAIEIFKRGLKDIKPLIPDWAEGLLLPVNDIVQVFETYLGLLEGMLIEHAKTPAAKQKERADIAKLRRLLCNSMAPYDGGLVQL